MRSNQSARSSNRREFLFGKSAVKEAASALETSVENVLEQANEGLASSSWNVDNLDRQAGYLEQYSKTAMACEFEFSFNLYQHSGSSSSAMSGFELLDQLEAQMTIYRSDSEISRLNQAVIDCPVPLESRLFSLLQRGQRLSKETQGAFDMTAGHLSQVWGFERRKGRVPDEAIIQQALATVGNQWLELDESNQTATRKRDGVKINLGGIGKGYALDRVSELILANEIDDFILHGGQSSLFASGSSDPRTRSSTSDHQSDEAADTSDSATIVDRATSSDNPAKFADSPQMPNRRSHAGWVIGITHPNLPQVRLAELTLRDCGLGTSGTARQGFYHRGKRYGHIIDPRTGWPASRYLSTNAIAPSAAEADALATAFFVMEPSDVEAYCRDHPDVGAVLLLAVPRSAHVRIVTLNVADEDWSLSASAE